MVRDTPVTRGPFVWIVRDPIERYISAWHGKFKCCADGTPCFTDASESLVKGLRAGRKCLSFDDYVDALIEAHEQIIMGWRPL